MDWNTLWNACITGSVVGAVTGITNWLLTRHLINILDKFEDKIKTLNGEK